MTEAIPFRVEFSNLKPVEGLVGPLDLTSETYREYDTPGRTYRISDPVALYYRRGGTTHRVVDKHGVTHCIPYGSFSEDQTVLRWVNKDVLNPVNF